jgi:hypothetical protein
VSNEAKMGSFYTGKSPPPAHRTGLFRPTDNKQAAKKLLRKDGKEWSQLDEAIPEERYLAQCSQVDIAVSLVDETGKSFKESRKTEQEERLKNTWAAD